MTDITNTFTTKELRDKVAEYCKNDIIITEVVCNEQRDLLSKALDDCHARYFVAQNTVPHDPPKREKKSSFDWYVLLSEHFGVKKAIFNDPATIVIWRDNTKTVVKCGERDTYDPEKGLALCFAKRALGNEGRYYNVFKELLPEIKEEKKPDKARELIDKLYMDMRIRRNLLNMGSKPKTKQLDFLEQLMHEIEKFDLGLDEDLVVRHLEKTLEVMHDQH